MAKEEDLVIDQGTDVSYQLNLVNVDGTVKNLTGYTGASQIRETFNSSDSDATDFSVTITDPATDGIVLLSLTNTQTSALEAGRYFYDVELYFYDSDSNQIVERILQGQIRVDPQVTRS